MKQIQPGIRLPKPLYDEVKRLAEEQQRSLNQQVVYMLGQAIEQERQEYGRQRTFYDVEQVRE